MVTSLLTVTENLFFVIGFSWCQSDIVNPFSPFSGVKIDFLYTVTLNVTGMSYFDRKGSILAEKL